MLGSPSSRTQRHDAAAQRSEVVAVDRMIESYVAWREACVQVRSAYERWWIADHDWQRFSYAAYAAALEQAEQAARVYQRSVERVTTSAPAGASTSPHADRPATSRHD